MYIATHHSLILCCPFDADSETGMGLPAGSGHLRLRRSSRGAAEVDTGRASSWHAGELRRGQVLDIVPAARVKRPPEGGECSSAEHSLAASYQCLQSRLEYAICCRLRCPCLQAVLLRRAHLAAAGTHPHLAPPAGCLLTTATPTPWWTRPWRSAPSSRATGAPARPGIPARRSRKPGKPLRRHRQLTASRAAAGGTLSWACGVRQVGWQCRRQGQQLSAGVNPTPASLVQAMTPQAAQPLHLPSSPCLALPYQHRRRQQMATMPLTTLHSSGCNAS